MSKRNKGKGKKVDTVKTESPSSGKDTRTTTRLLTRFEKSQAIATRANAIINGSPITIVPPKGCITPLEIATEELRQRKIPVIIRRHLMNGEYEDWDVKELIYD